MAFSRKRMVTRVRGLRRGAMIQAARDVGPGDRRQLSSPALPGILSYARCAQPVHVEMQARCEAPRCHRYGSPDPGDLCLHCQRMRNTHRQIPTRTGKNYPKYLSWKILGRKISVWALRFIWIRMVLNKVSLSILSKKTFQA